MIFDKSLIVSLMDLTSLNDTDTNQTITTLIDKVKTPFGPVAAICVYPQFIAYARQHLSKDIKLATVVNFPFADHTHEEVLMQTRQAINDGADEIDLVIPYQDYLKKGQSQDACTLIKLCKQVCGNRKLKVIIESGSLLKSALIEKASCDAIANGADFVKTSTGKVPTGATIKAARVILNVIKDSGRDVGFKASGGIKTQAQATEYLTLAKEICGESFINPETFRFGVSGLLDNLCSDVITKSVY
ncbi:deoxyribose-phosphate aldolase [Facilibium subflavum]|uniref:deoxyribose-phosphate aldolase n=1 Tax=Facilibium subflavum TaxID=2219058 RepID=UPI000E64ACF2|nr:deoxyribose-phosphate aldolase [Facilibium subflavum]